MLLLLSVVGVSNQYCTVHRINQQAVVKYKLPFPYRFPHQHLLIDGDSSTLYEEESLESEWKSKCLQVREPSVKEDVHRMADRERQAE